MTKSLETVARLILDGKVHQIIILAGAGISTASGIPDFRSPRTGLYANLKKFNLPFPEAIFDLDFFRRRPSAFYTLAKEIYPTGRYRPNVAHYFFRLLYQKKLLRRVYTQNIDGLERVAGVPPSKLVEAHGTFATAHCLRCRRSIPARVVKVAIDNGKVANCFRCKGLVKPDIVFFEEDLPQKFWRYREDLPKSDLIFVMGTSLEVQPFSRLVVNYRSNTTRVLLNRHAVGPFKKGRKQTDLVALGDISDLIRKLCRLLRWTEDLENLIVESEIKRVDYIGLGPLSVSSKTSPSCLRPGDTPRRASLGRNNFGTGFLYTAATTEDVGPMGALTAPATPDVIADECYREGGESALGMVEKVERIKMPRPTASPNPHLPHNRRSGCSLPPLIHRGSESTMGLNQRCIANFHHLTRGNTTTTITNTVSPNSGTHPETTDVTLLSKAISEMCLALDL